MPCGVGKPLGKTGCFQHTAGRSIDGLSRDAVAYGADRGLLSIEHCLKHLTLPPLTTPSAALTYLHSPGHVRAVPIEHDTEVECKQFTRTQRCRGGTGVRHAGAGSAGHDRVKAHTFGTRLARAELQFRGDIDLAPSRLNPCQHAVVELTTEGSGRCKLLLLLFFFHFAQFGDDWTYGPQPATALCGSQSFRELGLYRQRGVCRVHTARRGSARGKPTGGFVQNTCGRDADGGSAHFGARLVTVAPVGKKTGSDALPRARQHHQRAVRSGKPTEIPNVRQMRKQQGWQAHGLHLLRQSL